MDLDAEDNIEWLPWTIDLSEEPIVVWQPRRDLPDSVEVTTKFGEAHVLRMSYPTFDELYTGWLQNKLEFKGWN